LLLCGVKGSLLSIDNNSYAAENEETSERRLNKG
jgi:hypothetical protein